jgi:hypothetical protein
MVGLRLSLTTNLHYHFNQGPQTAGGKKKRRAAFLLDCGRREIGPRGRDELSVTIWQLDHQPVVTIALHLADYFECLI